MDKPQTRDEVIELLMQQQTAEVELAIQEGEDPSCFDLVEARAWFQSLPYDILIDQLGK